MIGRSWTGPPFRETRCTINSGQDDLLKQVNNRDTDGFTGLYERLANRLFGAAFRQVRDRGSAEDAVQQAFLELHRSSFRPTNMAALEAWMFTSVRYACLKEHRRRRRRPETPTDVLPQVAVFDDVDDGFDVDLEHALEQLSSDQRLILQLKHVEGFSGTEIASIIGSNRAAVYARATRAESRMRTLLTPVESHGV